MSKASEWAEQFRAGSSTPGPEFYPSETRRRLAGVSALGGLHFRGATLGAREAAAFAWWILDTFADSAVSSAPAELGSAQGASGPSGGAQGERG